MMTAEEKRLISLKKKYQKHASAMPQGGGPGRGRGPNMAGKKGKPKDMKTSSFWIIRKFVRDYVIQYKSHYTHLQGLFLRTTRKISSVPIKHFEREIGRAHV